MNIPFLPREQLRGARTQIEQALHNHEQWCEELYATLICRLPPDERDVQCDPHRHCRFGQWYYALDASVLAQQSGFQEVEIEHKRMHEFAAALLRTSADGGDSLLSDYERFVAAMNSMRLEMIALKQQLEGELSNCDPLTGLSNRVGMLAILREQHAMATRGVHNCCVAMLDLDHFKNINDSYGHPVGDNVLMTAAQCAREQLRPYDRLFRYGGEEFLLCMPNTDVITGREICDRIRESVTAYCHVPADEELFRATMSIGLAALDPAVSVEESLDRADKALYAAKAGGRNCTVVWSSSLIEVRAAE